jgi:hypothetical protein
MSKQPEGLRVLTKNIVDLLRRDPGRRLCVACIATGLGYTVPADRRAVYELVVEAWGTAAPFSVEENLRCEKCGSVALIAWAP